MVVIRKASWWIRISFSASRRIWISQERHRFFAPESRPILPCVALVGAPEKPLSVGAFALIFGNKTLSGSAIGGIAETQEMLDFCGNHNITSDVEVIPIQQINEAYERLLKSDVKYRFSIDMASLKD